MHISTKFSIIYIFKIVIAIKSFICYVFVFY